MDRPLRVLVLAGGPDRERAVSLDSGREVAAALRQAGHQVREADLTPGDLSALDEFVSWPGDAVFPVLHGPWGEGGPLQRLLSARRLPYPGARHEAASRCMDKAAAKTRLMQAGLPTPAFELVERGQRPSLAPPLVLKPLEEGSSLDVVICPDQDAVEHAWPELTSRHERLLVERLIVGLELTVGVIGRPPGAARPQTPQTPRTAQTAPRPNAATDRDPAGRRAAQRWAASENEPSGGATSEHEALPPLQIVPSTTFYDFDAKYARDDTRYSFTPPLSAATRCRVQELALAAHEALGCRDLSRVDFMVDAREQPFILEINTIPGFTSHSLLPKAAAHAGLTFPQLVDRLVRLASVDP